MYRSARDMNEYRQEILVNLRSTYLCPECLIIILHTPHPSSNEGGTNVTSFYMGEKLSQREFKYTSPSHTDHKQQCQGKNSRLLDPSPKLFTAILCLPTLLS